MEFDKEKEGNELTISFLVAAICLRGQFNDSVAAKFKKNFSWDSGLGAEKEKRTVGF